MLKTGLLLLCIRSHSFCFKDFMYLERGKGREKERERNIDVREKHKPVASGTLPNLGPNLQPRHVPWSRIEPATLCFAEWCPTNWATPVRAKPFLIFWNLLILLNIILYTSFSINRCRSTLLWLKLYDILLNGFTFNYSSIGGQFVFKIFSEIPVVDGW